MFTALRVPAVVGAALQHDMAVSTPPRGWRPADPSSRHITLAFHGEVDLGVHARRLERAVHGCPAPWVRLVGARSSAHLQWAGVETSGPELDELVVASGGDPTRFAPRVVVLRQRPRPGRDADPDPVMGWAGHVGPWWRPSEVVLMASEPAKGGPRHHVVHRVPLSIVNLATSLATSSAASLAG